MIEMDRWIVYGWALMLITVGLQSYFHALTEEQVAEHKKIPVRPFTSRMAWGLLWVSASVGAGLLLGWVLSVYSGPITEALRVVQDNLPPFVADPEELSPPHHFAREMAG